jgi:hypothetical protein
LRHVQLLENKVGALITFIRNKPDLSYVSSRHLIRRQ